MTNVNDDRAFKKEIVEAIPDDILSIAITWIAKNLKPDDVFDDSDLEEWAEGNGFVKS